MEKNKIIKYLVMIVILIGVMIYGYHFSGNPDRFLKTVICYILWFIAGFMQGRSSIDNTEDKKDQD